MIFCQLPNGRFSPNLATTRESMSPQNVSEWIFENFPFRGHLPPKPHNWIVSNRYIIQTSLQPRGRTAEILFTTRCSPRAREIPGFGQIYAPCVSPPWETPRERSLSPSEIYGCGGGLLVTSINTTYLLEIYCVELTRDPLAIAEFLYYLMYFIIVLLPCANKRIHE